MTKEELDEKYSYQIDEHNVVHLFRGEEDCQQHLSNPLLSAIFKIEQLKKENAELKYGQKKLLENFEQENAELKAQLENDRDLPAIAYMQGADSGYNKGKNEAKEIILKLYNAGRDVLMCRTEEKAYDNLSKAINDKSIEQFIKETE